MYCNPPAPQIVYSQHTADDIPTQVVKDKDLPYWIPIRAQDWRSRRYEAIGRGRVVVIYPIDRRGTIEIEDFLQRSYRLSVGYFS